MLSAPRQIARWAFTQAASHPAVSLLRMQLLCGEITVLPEKSWSEQPLACRRLSGQVPSYKTSLPTPARRALRRKHQQMCKQSASRAKTRLPQSQKVLSISWATPSFILRHLVEGLIRGALQVCWVPRK